MKVKAPALDKRVISGQRARMIETLTLPEECQTMLEVRAGVDQTDRELVDLLVRRFGYMRAAARIKLDRDTVRDEARKAAVIEAAASRAAHAGLPREVIADLWDRLVEASIAYEFTEWDRLRS